MKKDRTPSFERSPETQWAVDVLLEALKEPGAEVPYSDIEDAMGLPLPGEGSSKLASARRIVEKETGWVLKPVRGNGIRRLKDSELLKHVQTTRRKRIATQARKAKVELASYQDFDALPSDHRAQVMAEQSLMAMHEAINRQSRVDKVTTVIKNNGKILGMKEMLEALRPRS